MISVDIIFIYRGLVVSSVNPKGIYLWNQPKVSADRAPKSAAAAYAYSSSCILAFTLDAISFSYCYNQVPHEVWDIYVFHRFEAAAAGSKMCSISSTSLLQGSQSYCVNTYLGWSWSAEQSIELIVLDPAKWWPFLVLKNYLFALCFKSISLIIMKHSRGIAK